MFVFSIFSTLFLTISLKAAIPILLAGQFQIFLKRFSSSKLVLKTVESGFAALNYYRNVK